ncbi:DUF6542 domain-containing protein [Actinomadura rudentiformis]|uniref:DUF6542 domain-containing protein n=1 Tax=Actinomadura rudentiformis TaxID=359158 RepID=UPI00178C7090|nr:DUF6542 domain-containing protein [Actinomadura rudentiformis]
MRRESRASRSAASGGGPIALTGRGGIVVVFGTGLFGALFARWFDMAILAGLAFTVGCALAALMTRAADLLTLAVSPPLIFFAVTLLAEVITTMGEGSLVRGVTVGLVTTMAGTAPWLFLGTILVIVISIPRGLVTAFKDLRTKLAGIRLFEEEENENPVRWDETPTTRGPRPRHARKEDQLPHSEVD